MAIYSEPLTPEQELYARTMFRNRIYQSNGQRYEDLFIDVMTKRDSRFRPVKPQGSFGDEKNDGFIKEEGRYYQVYAPEDLSQRVDQAAEKARDDFKGLKEKWEKDAPIVHFHFVFNDKFQGAYPKVEHALSELQSKHNLQTSEPFLAKDLERYFMELTHSDKIAVLGAVIPRPDYIADIDYAALTEILQHLVDNQTPIPHTGLPSVPDFVEKIQFNGLVQAGNLLNVGNFQNAAVDRFFDNHGEYTKTDIRNRLAKSYENALTMITENPLDETFSGDSVFFRLLNDIAPDSTRQVQDAAIVLIAYFFEKCDVFNDPS